MVGFRRFGVKKPRHSETILDEICYVYCSTRLDLLPTAMSEAQSCGVFIFACNEWLTDRIRSDYYFDVCLKIPQGQGDGRS